MNYDAIVIGAGPAGSMCALALARAGWRVAIVEKAGFPRRKVCGEFVSAPALSLLARAGLEDVMAHAGPEIRVVAIYAGERIVSGAMPRANGGIAYGRALGRDRLDDRLLRAARDAGAEVWQPWRVTRYARIGAGYVCSIERKLPKDEQQLAAPVVIAAHGSSDTGRISPGPARRAATRSDLFAFKARFKDAALSRSTMPLVAFPGGYGGLVTSDSDEVSFSCCISREALGRCRGEVAGGNPGAAVLGRVFGACRGMREALEGATRQGAWLASGPMRAGFHAACADGAFAVGNACAEAHPIVAEGISMAIQSAMLLSERLIAASPACRDWKEVARSYEAAYRRNFGGRIRASAAFAQLAMRPSAANAVGALLERAPALLVLGARWAGKSSPLNAGA
jgi:flavin-dependent dehydrogenase